MFRIARFSARAALAISLFALMSPAAIAGDLLTFEPGTFFLNSDSGGIRTYFVGTHQPGRYFVVTDGEISGGRIGGTLIAITNGTGSTNSFQLSSFDILGQGSVEITAQPFNGAFNPVQGSPFTLSGTPQTISFDPAVEAYGVHIQGQSTFFVDNMRFLNTLGDVPEPASWAMMIAGFGMIGSVARRRPGKLVAST